MHGSQLTRREFARRLTGLAALGVVDPILVMRALGSEGNHRLSWLANRTAQVTNEARPLTSIEGIIPGDIDGTLYRIGPGQKETFGVTLRHFFDGDAFVSAFDLREGRATLRARFIETPERMEEQAAGRMLYAEFGTPVPSEAGRRKGVKNQPSINIVPWDGRLIGLSEGGHPTAIDPGDLSCQGPWDFHGTLPASAPFTAHPKFDPATGEGFAYGISRGIPPTLMIWRMNPSDGTLSQIHGVKLPSYLMIHDMLLGPEHLIFVAPPVTMDFKTLFAPQGTIADALRYFESQPLRIILVRRDGAGDPVLIEQPAGLVFHNGNAWMKDGSIVIDTMLAPDGSALESIYAWSRDRLPDMAQPVMTRLVLDPVRGMVVGRSEIDVDQEFPRFDARRIGRHARYLYTMESGNSDDPFAFTHLVRHDLERGRQERAGGAPGRAFGETVFVPREGSPDEAGGWLMTMGYDASRDESFLEIKEAATLELAARIWTGLHLPLGFHGNFIPGRRLTPV